MSGFTKYLNSLSHNMPLIQTLFNTFCCLETALTPADPDWVGAWWLGSVAISAAILLCTLPFFAYPRDLQAPADGKSASKMLRRQSSIYDVPESGTKAEKLRPILQRKVSTIEVQSIKGESSVQTIYLVYY